MNEGPYEVLRATPGGERGLPGPRGWDLLRAFSAVSRALNLGQPLSLTLDLIAEKVSQTIGHMYCAIYLLDHEIGELRIEGSHGLSEEYVEGLNSDLVQRVDGDGERASTVTVTAFRSRLPMYVADITKDPRFGLAREMIVEAGYNSVVSLPLVFRGEAIGVLNCYDRHRDYSEEQVEALVAVAEQVAGMPPGDYELSVRKVRLKDGAVRLPDGTLAGGVLTMDAAVRNAVQMLRIPLREAVRMATETPVEVLGARDKGRIVPGADADLVVLGPGGAVEETMVAGKTLHERRKEDDGQRP